MNRRLFIWIAILAMGPVWPGARAQQPATQEQCWLYAFGEREGGTNRLAAAAVVVSYYADGQVQGRDVMSFKPFPIDTGTNFVQVHGLRLHCALDSGAKASAPEIAGRFWLTQPGVDAPLAEYAGPLRFTTQTHSVRRLMRRLEKVQLIGDMPTHEPGMVRTLMKRPR